MARVTLRGLKKVKRNAKKAAKVIRINMKNGIRKSSSLVKSDSLLETPVEFGDLRRSAFYSVKKSGSWVIGIIGYKSEYAPAVHFASGKLMGDPRPSGIGNYWDPNGQPQFLFNALYSNQSNILNIIMKETTKVPF